MEKRCIHCGKLIDIEDLLEHEANCYFNLENVDEGSSEECGDW